MAKSREMRLYINGYEIECETENKAFAQALEIFTPHIPYMSDAAIKKILCDIWNMIYGPEEEGGLECRQYGASNKSFKSFINKPYIYGNKLKEVYFDIILRKEGLYERKPTEVNKFGDKL